MKLAKEEIEGLFFSDSAQIRNKIKASPKFWGPMPSIPATGWTTPTEFPNLSNSSIIGYDTETYDPELKEAGPGWGRGKGHIVGVSLAADDGSSWYFPMRHGIDEDGKQQLPPEHAAMNMNPDNVLSYLAHTLGDNRPKTGANLTYDKGWLAQEGVKVGGLQYDVQYAAALLDSETPSVSLEKLAQKYLNMGKESELLYEWLGQWNGKKVNSDQRKWIYTTPPRIAGPYAEGDAYLPIDILKHQWPEMQARGVLDLFHLECKLIPLLVEMRMKGAPVNLDRAEQTHSELGVRLDKLRRKMYDIAGTEVNPNSTNSMSRAFDSLGIKLPTKTHKETKEDVVTFDKTALKSVSHPLAATVLDYKGLMKVRDTFVEAYIINKHVNSRVYCSFHPLKGLTNGARSGRLASSDPNLQNIPVRSDEGKMVRHLFDGTVFANRWRSYDYSSIEYRLLVHFAVGPGAAEVRKQFADKPETDYHQFVMELIFRMTAIQLERGSTKTINFGIIYGMQLNALSVALKLPKNEAQKLLDMYHEAIPYASATMDACAQEVHKTGQIVTLLGRVSDFNAWGKKGYDAERSIMSYEKAVQKWGIYNIERQQTHKALNRKLQGSAADVMKLAMVTAYEDGLFAEHACGIPILTVHDELDFEDKGDLDNPAWAELKHTMENCAAHLLKVPLIVDSGIAPTWRDAH